MKIPVIKNEWTISEISLPESSVTLSQFCGQYCLEIKIKQRDYDIWKNDYCFKYYTTFNYLVEEVKGNILTPVKGDGYTPKCALKDLVKNLSNKELRINFCDRPYQFFTKEIVIE